MRKKEILKAQVHRPFPLPKMPWAMQQTWKDILFLHYRIPYNVLRKVVPPELELDMYDGGTWISITPFKMRNVRFRFLPPIPTATNFLEMNLRTYVSLNGRGGIYFFSLDTSSRLSALGARMGFLPYFTADMNIEENDGEFHFRSSRPNAAFEVKYKPKPPFFECNKGSLEYWLVERYCLFQETIKGIFIEIDIHHMKWLLQTAEAKIYQNSLTKPAGFALPDEPPLVHYSTLQDVLVWPPKILSKK